MADTDTTASPGNESDRDILAVRSMIAAQKKENQPDRQLDRSPRTGEEPVVAGDVTTAPRAPDAKSSSHAKVRQGRTTQVLKRVERHGRKLIAMLVRSIRNYRPDRKVILRTSLVLLLILQPFFVIGSVLLVGFALLLTYLFAGPDRFWRKIIALYQAFARKKPQAARVVKLRAYVLSKKWDAFLEWGPQGLSDHLRSPDLREIIAADKRHEQALSHRLDRLHKDFVA